MRALAGSTVGSNTFEGELSIFRLKPPVLRLEDEVIALLLSKISNEGCISRSYSRRVFEITNLTNISLSNPFTKIVEIELSDEGEKLAQWLVPRRLEIFSSPDIILRRTVKLQTIPTWRDVSKDRDFEMLTRCLRALFPKATFTSTSAAPDVWDIPVPDNFHPVGSIRRAMQMATTKVVVGKQLQVNRDRMEEYLSRSVEPIMLKRIHGVLRSISGHIELPGGTLLADSTKCALFGRKVALIDACAEFISIRIVDNFGYDSKLVACGNMDSDEFNFVDNLLSLCYLHRLERRSHITYSDLTDHEILKVQKESSHVELPGGCWYDGNVYLDVSGSRSRLRPDIRILAEGYIAKRNAQFDIYNRLISDGMGDTF